MIFPQRLIRRKKKRKREKDEHYDFSNVQTMMRERYGLAPAIQEVAGDRELLQREARREPLRCISNAVGEGRGMLHSGEASKGRVRKSRAGGI
jgi:hypothetical protein